MHNLLPKLRKLTNLKILDLVEETVREIKKRKLKKIAILATTKTKISKLYDKFLNNIEILYPNSKEQKKISEIIIRILSKKIKSNDKKYLGYLITKFKKQGCEKIILACTDLSNIIEKNNFIIDTQEILINSIRRRMDSFIK